MLKVAPGDLKAILRLFDVKRADDSDKHIDQVKVSHPLATNTLVAFRFDKRRYFVLYDETAEDDVDYMKDQIRSEAPDVSDGEFLPNPLAAPGVHGVPHKGKTVYLYSVDAGKRRLDIALAEKRPETSRSTWQKHIKAGSVTVNGTVVTSAKQEVDSSDDIVVNLPDEPDHSKLELPVLFMDENVIVISKPVGILSHSKGELNDEFTVADFFRRYTSVGLETSRPGIIHRLDRDTSGVMVGARNVLTASLLSRQFADRKTKKTYVAVVSGRPKQDEAVIDLPIGRNPSAPSTFRVDPKGRSATTHYKVLATNGKESLVVLKPVTGRTHQLRVHMAHLGTPIIGDRVYGKAADRLFLHAYSLEITIPKGDRRVFTADVPKEFTLKFDDVPEL